MVTLHISAAGLVLQLLRCKLFQTQTYTYCLDHRLAQFASQNRHLSLTMQMATCAYLGYMQCVIDVWVPCAVDVPRVTNMPWEMDMPCVIVMPCHALRDRHTMSDTHAMCDGEAMCDRDAMCNRHASDSDTVYCFNVVQCWGAHLLLGPHPEQP